ncbi:hypothetical protein N7535_005030 [Penicillium sp. DV-2018c]|nr:hypothetical protein N7461_008611 [Penicillium sp. DV-2018c]KAJ5571370.1 hypothetical protein N7535_005030 [Penicillium sp. DV-2018c]
MSALPLTPPTASSRTVMSANAFKILPQFEEAVSTFINGVTSFHQLVITEVPPGWEDYIWDAEENLAHITRKSWDPASCCLQVKVMPTRAHNCVSEWIGISISRACATGLLNIEELEFLLLQSGTTLQFREGPYRGWKKEPDALIFNPSEDLPALVAEVGWSETSRELLNDMNKLLVGGNGVIKVCIVVKWQPHTDNTVTGVVDVWKLNHQGIPTRTQTEPIFPMPAGDPPQPLDVRRRDLYPVQPPRDPNERFLLDVSRLRHHARISLARMGYVPA